MDQYLEKNRVKDRPDKLTVMALVTIISILMILIGGVFFNRILIPCCMFRGYGFVMEFLPIAIVFAIISFSMFFLLVKNKKLLMLIVLLHCFCFTAYSVFIYLVHSM